MTPKVIIIVLNRGKNNVDFNEEFDFPLYLDLNNQGIIINSKIMSKILFMRSYYSFRRK